VLQPNVGLKIEIIGTFYKSSFGDDSSCNRNINYFRLDRHFIGCCQDFLQSSKKQTQKICRQNVSQTLLHFEKNNNNTIFVLCRTKNNYDKVFLHKLKTEYNIFK
jgi:hypothetical protein